MDEIEAEEKKRSLRNEKLKAKRASETELTKERLRIRLTGSNFSRIASGTIATPTTDYIATSILHHIFIIILALY